MSNFLKKSSNGTKLLLFLFFITFWVNLSLLNYDEVVGQGSVTNVSVTTAYNMINDNNTYPDLIILDVRTVGEYNSGHLCEALLIPVEELAGRIDEVEVYKNTEIIVYCRTGVRSQQASDILSSNNFTQIFNMLGGITAWIDAGYSLCYDQISPVVSISFTGEIFLISLLGIIATIILIIKSRKNT